MADISKISLEGTSYNIKDGTARADITTLDTKVDNNYNTLNGKIDNIINGSNRRYVFIGDSYNTSDTPSGGVQITPWGGLVASYMGLSNGTYYTTGLSGAGWSRDTSGTFLQLLQGLNIQNKNDITDIVVCGGINDNNQTDSQVLDAVEAFSQHVATNYPNAKIHVGCVAWSTNDGLRNYLEHASCLYEKFGRYSNIDVMSNAITWLHNYAWIQPDGNHPYLEGSRHIAEKIANFLKGGNSETRLKEELTVTATNQVFSTTGNMLNITQVIDGNTLTIETALAMGYNTLSFNASVTSINLQETNGRWSKQLGTISGNRLFLNLDTNKNIIQSGVASIMKTDNSYIDNLVPYAIEVYANNVYIELFGQITIQNPKLIILKPNNTGLTTAVTRM